MLIWTVHFVCRFIEHCTPDLNTISISCEFSVYHVLPYIECVSTSQCHFFFLFFLLALLSKVTYMQTSLPPIGNGKLFIYLSLCCQCIENKKYITLASTNRNATTQRLLNCARKNSKKKLHKSAKVHTIHMCINVCCWEC